MVKCIYTSACMHAGVCMCVCVFVRYCMCAENVCDCVFALVFVCACVCEFAMNILSYKETMNTLLGHTLDVADNSILYNYYIGSCT